MWQESCWVCMHGAKNGLALRSVFAKVRGCIRRVFGRDVGCSRISITLTASILSAGMCLSGAKATNKASRPWTVRVSTWTKGAWVSPELALQSSFTPQLICWCTIILCRSEIISQCWMANAQDRPTFSDIVTSLSYNITQISGYGPQKILLTF